jgi:hypothetical protein
MIGYSHLHDKVPEPVIGSTYAVHTNTKMHRGHFGAVEKVAAQETERIKGVEQKDEEC